MTGNYEQEGILTNQNKEEGSLLPKLALNQIQANQEQSYSSIKGISCIECHVSSESCLNTAVEMKNNFRKKKEAIHVARPWNAPVVCEILPIEMKGILSYLYEWNLSLMNYLCYTPGISPYLNVLILAIRDLFTVKNTKALLLLK